MHRGARGVKMELQMPGVGVRPQETNRNDGTDSVDFWFFTATAVLSLGGHRRSFKIPKS